MDTTAPPTILATWTGPGRRPLLFITPEDDHGLPGPIMERLTLLPSDQAGDARDELDRNGWRILGERLDTAGRTVFIIERKVSIHGLQPREHDVRIGHGIGWRTCLAVDVLTREVTVNGNPGERTVYPIGLVHDAYRRRFPSTSTPPA